MQVSQKKIDIQRPLVRLVDDQNLIGLKKPISR